jgi:hypothetical protein
LIGVSSLDYIEALVAQIRGRSYSKQAVVLDDQDSGSCWQAGALIGRSLATRLDSFTIAGHRRNLHWPFAINARRPCGVTAFQGLAALPAAECTGLLAAGGQPMSVFEKHL